MLHVKTITSSLIPLLIAQEGAAAGPAPQFVKKSSNPMSAAADGQGTWDVVVCGGTLGVFLAAALAQRGLRVAVVEAQVLRGRAQEWNISRKEMQELVEVGVVTCVSPG
jgi:hypothetical protein